MNLHFNTTKAHKTGGALAIALTLGVAGCGSAQHLTATTTQAAAAVHKRAARHSAEHHRGHGRTVRPQAAVRTISRRAHQAKPVRKAERSAPRRITRSRQHPKPAPANAKPPAHQRTAATHQRRSTQAKPSRTTTTKTRSGRTTLTPDGGGTAGPTSLNAAGAATGGGQTGQTGQTGASPTGAAGQGVSADG